jgi:hypothetical protein
MDKSPIDICLLGQVPTRLATLPGSKKKLIPDELDFTLAISTQIHGKFGPVRARLGGF